MDSIILITAFLAGGLYDAVASILPGFTAEGKVAVLEERLREIKGRYRQSMELIPPRLQPTDLDNSGFWRLKESIDVLDRSDGRFFPL